MQTTALEELGLTPKEAGVYLSLLELGSASATQLIQKCGLHRAVVYDLLERLIEKGLASFVIKGRKKYFEAASPERLLEMEKQREEKIKEILPQLLELSKFTSKLEVKIFKGTEGLKTVFEDLIASLPKEWLVIGSSGTTIQLLPYYLAHFQKRRSKLGIITKALMINNETGRRRGEELKKLPHTQVRHLPRNITTPTVIQVYNDKTILHSNTSETPFVIVIENKDITASFKEYFGTLWKIAKP
jgi:sugar-specific transcriptional regulator TrmB